MILKNTVIAIFCIITACLAIEFSVSGGLLPVRNTTMSVDQHSLISSEADSFLLTAADPLILRITPTFPVFGGNAILSATISGGETTIIARDKRQNFKAKDKPGRIQILVHSSREVGGNIYFTAVEEPVLVSNIAVTSLSRHQTIWPTSLNILGALLIFAPIAFALGFVSDLTWRKRATFVASLLFLSALSLSLMILMVTLTFLGYILVQGLHRKRLTYWPMVALIASSLLFFKLVAPIALSFEQFGVRTIWLPIGLSYLVARHIDLAQKISIGQVKHFSLFDFFDFSLFWPSSTAGPITEYDRFNSDRNVFVTPHDRFQGLPRIGAGLAKKIFAEIVFTLLVAENYDAVLVAGDAGPGTLLSFYLGNLLFVYFDFSGYTDIAVGVSRTMGARIPENFNRPLSQWNMRLFWRHWHMSLTQWISRLVFMPLSILVRRELPWVRYFVPIFATTLTIGLWHGFQVSWLLWSIHHGIGIIFSDYLIRFESYCSKSGWPFFQKAIQRMGVIFVWYWLMLSYCFTLTSHPVVSMNQYLKLLALPFTVLRTALAY